jgi:uncharacterized membrane protein YphA (DoxX/SURF4 family)
MNALTGIVAKILYSIPFIVFGIGHFTNASMMAGMVPVPGGVFWVYFTGIAMIAAAIALLSGYQGKLAMLLLALLLFIYIVSIHIPNMMNPETQLMGMMGALKDCGLMGGALAFAGILDKQGKEKTNS